jgi:RNA polymerase sigma factor (sigma-70 family)
MTDASDADLLVGSIDDVDRFGELYDRHVEAVLAFHYRRVRCAATAADLTAETFAAAFTSRHRFRDTGAPARAWLFTIARRQLSHFQRRERVADRARRRLGVSLDLALDDGDVERIEALADLAPLRRDLAAALDALPAGQADAVRLRVAEDLPYPEVARRLGCSEDAARARVSRGIARLTAEMGATA